MSDFQLSYFYIYIPVIDVLHEAVVRFLVTNIAYDLLC